MFQLKVADWAHLLVDARRATLRGNESGGVFKCWTLKLDGLELRQLYSVHARATNNKQNS